MWAGSRSTPTCANSYCFNLRGWCAREGQESTSTTTTGVTRTSTTATANYQRPKVSSILRNSPTTNTWQVSSREGNDCVTI
jgi:hypothetical protein